MTYDPNNPNRIDPNRRIARDRDGMSGAMMAGIALAILLGTWHPVLRNEPRRQDRFDHDQFPARDDRPDAESSRTCAVSRASAESSVVISPTERTKGLSLPGVLSSSRSHASPHRQPSADGTSLPRRGHSARRIRRCPVVSMERPAIRFVR